MSELWTDGKRLIRAPNMVELEWLVGATVELERDRKLAAVERATNTATADAIRDAVGGLGARLKLLPLLSGISLPDLDWRGFWRLLRADEYILFDDGPVQADALMDGAAAVLADNVLGKWVRR